MNWIDHIFRERTLAGSAAVTLTTGTAEALYPIANVYNGRPGIPFRSQNTSIVIDIDFGVSPPSIDHILLLATNLEGITGNAIFWRGGNVFPPAAAVAAGDVFQPPGTDNQKSDWAGTSFLYPAYIVFAFPQVYRYHRLEITQNNRAAGYTQIGEVWFEESGNYAWHDLTNYERQQTSFSWPLISDARLSRERHSKVRGARLGFSEDFLGMDINAAATIWEMMFRAIPFCFSAIEPVIGIAAPDRKDVYGTRLDGVSITEVYVDDWNATRQTSSILKTMDGDGKI